MTMPPKKIIVALDDSDAAVTAWKVDAGLARRAGAVIEGLYVKQWAYAVSGYGSTPEAGACLLDEAGLARLRRRLPQARIRVSRGMAAAEIAAWADRRGGHLLVMGTHGREGLERAVMGSVAEAVISASRIPVLVVRRALPKSGGVLAPVTDAPYSRSGLTVAARWAAWLHLRLRVLHVAEQPILGRAMTPAQARAIAAGAVAGLPPALRQACRQVIGTGAGDPAREIVARAGAGDLIVLSAHVKGFLQDSVLGSTAQRVLRHTQAAVLAVPADDPARR